MGSDRVTIADAYDRLKQAMQDDSIYAWGWHCNVAVASQDEGMEFMASNRAAARFMFNAFGVDTSKSQHYKDVMQRAERDAGRAR